MSVLAVIAIAFGILWFIGAMAGCCAYLECGSDDSADYARALFWPIVFFVFICKGIAKLIQDA